MTENNQPRVSDLIFSSATDEIKRFTKESRRSALTVTNRLKSIDQDAAFVKRVQEFYEFPLIANERCGSWYIDPEDKAQSAYFKSTDGHAGQWSFSLRRLNLHVLESIAQHEGCIIVDSTRRGKSMPDALSKTIPIWITVINKLLGVDVSYRHALRTPDTVVPPSEHSQMAARIDGFFEQLKSLNLDLSDIEQGIGSPMVPFWITQDQHLPYFEWPADHYPIFLCTASRRVPGGEDSENGYIQGAADDHESWAHGLTAELFWKHKARLLDTAEDELPSLIAEIVQNQSAGITQSTLVRPTTQLYVSTLDSALVSLDDVTVLITISPQAPSLPEGTDTKHIHLTCAAGKVGSRQLRHEIPKIQPVLDAVLNDAATRSSARILVACPSGKDHSIGVALAVLCLYADDQGDLVPRNDRTMTKDYIKQRLSWLSVSMPDANPSRTTLQSVNAVLLG
ncbi:hypothetical protein MBLNU457_g0727t1 [Dothideomycetes sp. NU457]